jgi:hypothetical protein
MRSGGGRFIATEGRLRWDDSILWSPACGGAAAAAAPGDDAGWECA